MTFKKAIELLRDIRWCYRTKPVAGERLSPGKLMCRQLQEKDPTEFLKMYRDLEVRVGALKNKPTIQSSASSGAPSGTSGGVTSVDKGSEKVEALIEELQVRMGWKT